VRRAYVLIGVGLIVVGFILSASAITVSDTFGPETTTLTKDTPWDYHGVPVNKGTTIIVNFRSQKPGGQVSAILLPEDKFGELQDLVKTNPLTLYAFPASLAAPEASGAQGILAKAQGEQGKLQWTATEDGTYFALYMTPTEMETKQENRTITEQTGYVYYWTDLRVGSVFSAAFECRDADDQIRAFLLTSDQFDRFQGGETIPKDQLLADTAGHSGIVTWVSPSDGRYYLVVKPVAGHWPVPYQFSMSAARLLAGSEWPLSLTYTMEGEREGPWYLGVIVIIVGVAVLALGFRRKAVSAAAPTAPAYAPSTPTTAVPQRPTPSPAAQFCVHCGAEIAPSAKFCRKCGKAQA
jgi:hypothetical protein